MKKRILGLFLTFAMLITFAPITTTQAASISIGDYIQMGTYYGKPILWRCVDIDKNGPLMLSDKIICLKPFDAVSSVNIATGSHSRGRENYASNYWADSNIRSWLNSSASAGNVQWLCGNPPMADKVTYNNNAYDREAGFLTNFTDKELRVVKEVTQKSLVSYQESDNGIYTMGAEQHVYRDYIDSILQNYDTAYAEYVTDKMFLLDVKQVNAVYNNGNILGSDYYIGEPTAQCIANSEYQNASLTIGEKWYYWLRSPGASYYSLVRCVYSGGYVNNDSAQYSGIGVRPAFYLNTQYTIFKSGYGTSSDPYAVSTSDEEPFQQRIPTIISADVTHKDGRYVFDISLADVTFDCQLLTVLYDENKAMTGIKCTEICYNDTEKAVTIPADTSKTAKIFIWNSLYGMKPLCEAVNIDL